LLIRWQQMNQSQATRRFRVFKRYYFWLTIMKKINLTIFLLATIICWLVISVSFVAAFAEDEGTLPENLFAWILAKSFYVFSFPSLFLLNILTLKVKAVTYFCALWFNGLFYGTLIERLIFLYRNRQTMSNKI
jgi:hypothetical protein